MELNPVGNNREPVAVHQKKKISGLGYVIGSELFTIIIACEPISLVRYQKELSSVIRQLF